MFIAFYSTVLQLRRYNTFMWLRNINMPRAAALSPEEGTLGFCVVRSKLTTANVSHYEFIYSDLPSMGDGWTYGRLGRFSQ